MIYVFKTMNFVLKTMKFVKYDGDSDGDLDFIEFCKLAKTIKLASKKKDLEKMFTDIDTGE